MDPLTLGVMAAGLGSSIFGGLGQASASKQMAQVSENEASTEQQINNQKQMQMNLQAQRSQLENFRNTQRARAQGLNAATQQGAQFGSGLAGGQAQAQDQGIYNALGINQSLQTGNAIAGDQFTISQDKIQMAKLGGQSATDAGISSLGGALIKSGPIIGQLGKGVGGINFSGLFGGGSPSGYGS